MAKSKWQMFFWPICSSPFAICHLKFSSLATANCRLPTKRMTDLFQIRGAVSPRLRLALGFASWGLIIAAWFVLTYWDLLPPFALPKPGGVISAFGRLWVDYNLLGNVLQSWWRIAQAFFWCACIAIPLGILMASFRWV